MANNNLPKLTSEDNLSFTYVSGLGFVSIDSTRSRLRQIRRTSNLLCFLTISYYLFMRFFNIPFTRLAYLLGFDIKINQYTGLIIASKITKNLILILMNSFSLLLACLCCIFLYKKTIRKAHIFKKPNGGTLSVSLPICLSMTVIACFFTLGFSFVFGHFGFVFSSFSANSKITLSPSLIFMLLTTLAKITLEELFFRGIMVTTLRRFGDGFAVVASAMVFSLWGANSMEMIYFFFIGITLGYFLIRSGSVLTPIIARLVSAALFFLYYLSKSHLEPSLHEVITLLTIIVIFILAFFAFFKFIKHDKNAFHLLEPNDKLTVKTKLLSFSSTFFFVLLCVNALFRIISLVQIID